MGILIAAAIAAALMLVSTMVLASGSGAVKCGEWSDCYINGQQYRTCQDDVEIRACHGCYMKCTWWSACGPYGQNGQWVQSRHCTDVWCGGGIDRSDMQAC